MSKILNVPEAIDKPSISTEGTEITVLSARIIHDQGTSMGVTHLGIGLTVKTPAQKEASAMFSLDKTPITGSIGRILSAFGLTDTDEASLEKFCKEVKGKKLVIRNRGGKLYWTVPK